MKIGVKFEHWAPGFTVSGAGYNAPHAQAAAAAAAAGRGARGRWATAYFMLGPPLLLDCAADPTGPEHLASVLHRSAASREAQRSRQKRKLYRVGPNCGPNLGL